MTKKYQCPRCGQLLHCGCTHCAKRNNGRITYKYQENGEVMFCGRCGLAAHADWWLDEECRQLRNVMGLKYRPRYEHLNGHIQALTRLPI